MQRVITNFHGANEFLSNFYPAEVAFEGEKYSTTEAAFQAAKTLDPRERYEIQYAATPSEAKRLGRRVQLRGDWETIKVDVMHKLLQQKFAPGTECAKRLEDTGHAVLVEGTHWHDITWGIDLDHRPYPCGKNLLGQLLMRVRDENRGQTEFLPLHMEMRTDWQLGGPFVHLE